MWTFLSVIFISLATAYSYGNISLAIPDFTDILKSALTAEVSEICAEHIEEYFQNAITGPPNYVKMFDSMTKFPDGLLLGQINFPGHYDECVSAVTENFNGQHCMIRIKLDFSKDNTKLTDIYFKPKGKDQNVVRYSFGFCFPSTCNSTDIKNMLENAKNDFMTLDLSENSCSVSGYQDMRTEDWVTVTVLITILIISLGSTGYDLFQRFYCRNEKPNHFWSSFSLYTNTKQLFQISQSSSQLKCLHGFRFLSMCWVILGHCYFTMMFASVINNTEVVKILHDKSFAIVSNAFVSVDSFFFLSGLLVCLVFFRDISTKKTFDVPVAFIHRYIRLTPPFALLMLIQATILSRMGNGPFWNQNTVTVERACRESWWTGLLYVQNYLKPTAMCLGQAWYLSADMQMYWLSPLILYPILWFPSLAQYFILVLILMAAAVNFSVTFIYNLKPNLLLSDYNQFEKEYAPFHTRMAPWLIGLATGYIICGLQAKKIRLNMSKMWVACGWLATIFLLAGSVYGINRFIDSEFSQLESSSYIAFHRVGWALGLAWVVIACVGGYGGPVNDFLSLDIFQPLGKLSYCNFLIHMAVQNYRINSSRTNHYITHYSVVYLYFGDLIISNLLSIPVVLLFELPFTNLDRHFLRKLVIFPLPRPKRQIENENSEKKSENDEKPQDVEKGNVNPVFTES